MYPYISQEPGDLPFEAGEVIYVTQKEGEWWTGSIGADRVGIFPANYVDKQSELQTEEHVENNLTDDVMFPINKFTTDFPAFEGMGSKTELEPYEEAEIKREIGEFAKGPPKSPKTVKSKKYEIATVLANYQPTGAGQLTLTRGQLITVRKKAPSGWWEGELQVRSIMALIHISFLCSKDIMDAININAAFNRRKERSVSLAGFRDPTSKY